MKKVSLIILLLISVFSCLDQSSSDQVVLKGKLVNWGNAPKMLIEESLRSDFGLGNDIIIETDSDQRFEIVFELQEATYYSLGRNKLFLTPGDQLSIEVDYRDPLIARFSGDHARLQEYLRGVPLLKSGSYLSGGTYLQTSEIQETLDLADSMSSIHLNILLSLKGASDEFKTMEKMRIQLDRINTVLSMPVYGSFKGFWAYSEDQKAEILSQVKSELKAMSQGLMQDDFMKHPNFRAMLLDLINPQLQSEGIFDHLTMTPFMKAYDEVGAFVSQIESEGLNARIQALAEDYLGGSHPPKYKALVKEKLDEYSVLKEDQPAPDIVFSNAIGEEVNLSDFKGELIYVDLWATWCGPCIDELPAFEALKHEFKDEAISFVPISIDTDVDRWQKYLKSHNLPRDQEYMINQSDLGTYKVITIPRYFLIDQDFKIIDVFATKPSDPMTQMLIEQYLAALRSL